MTVEEIISRTDVLEAERQRVSRSFNILYREPSPNGVIDPVYIRLIGASIPRDGSELAVSS